MLGKRIVLLAQCFFYSVSHTAPVACGIGPWTSSSCHTKMPFHTVLDVSRFVAPIEWKEAQVGCYAQRFACGDSVG